MSATSSDDAAGPALGAPGGDSGLTPTLGPENGSAGLTAPVAVDQDAGDRDYETEIRGLRAEAKRNRIAAHAAAEERDSLRSRIDGYDRREVERQIADRVQSPSDFWLTTDIASLRDEEGQIDQERVSERIDQVLGERPHWRRMPPADFSSGVRRPIKPAKSLGEAFKQSLLGGR
jgi:hypothetical protein